MKRLSVLCLCVVCATCACTASEYHLATRLDDNLWLIENAFTVQLDRQRLVRLYRYLGQTVMPDCTSPLLSYLRLPVYVHIATPQAAQSFPHSSEGLAGLCGHCRIACSDLGAGYQLCDLGPDNAATTAVLIIVVAPDPDPVQFWGFTTHELSHAFGAVDGPCDPFFEPDNRVCAYQVRTSDAYFWFGRASLFEDDVQGAAWRALTQSCEAADPHCEQLRVVFE